MASMTKQEINTMLPYDYDDVLDTILDIGCRLLEAGAEVRRVEDTVERYKKETGDTRILYMGFTDQLPEDGYAADWHPTEITHTKASEKLTEEIKKIMNW